MNSHDILSAAMDESGLVSEQNNDQPSTSFQFNLAQQQRAVQKSDIAPFVLNGQTYFKTPRGVVQFKPGNKISLVSEMELRQAYLAHNSRKLIEMNNLNNFSQFLNNGQPINPFFALNNQFINSQLTNNGPLLSNPKFSTQFLYNNSFKEFGQLPNLLANNQTQYQPAGNYKLQEQILLDNNQQSTSRQSRMGFNFEEIYKEVSEEDKAVEDEDEFQATETYSEYMPSKLRIGLKHPDPVVETATLSSVQPPDCYYQLSIPEEIMDRQQLSALQLESIVYACQQHDKFLPDGTRAGFLVGDGAGVGKGRTVAGIIYENYLNGRKKALWFSVSADLKLDAERDLYDIGAKDKIKVHALKDFKYGKISSSENKKVKKGVIFSTYSALISESSTVTGRCKTRIGQLIEWFGKDFDGVIIFDECHKAKNLIPDKSKGGKSKSTKTAIKVLELQQSLPNARVVYASATGATEPRNLAYMVRLGLWGKGLPFETFNDFHSAVSKRGVGAMELVAIDMKQRGLYIARQLSFKGVTFDIHNVELAPEFIELYDDCVKLWEIAREKFEVALNLMVDENKLRKQILGQFWSSHQRFFKYLCIAAKVNDIVKIARDERKNGNCIVIGLQSTGEAKTLEAIEESGGELNDFVSTAKAVFQNMVEKNFPAPNRKKSLALLGLDKNFLKDEESVDYSNRSSRRARQETQKKITKSVKSFINDESETENDSETEIESLHESSSTENIDYSEDDEKKKSKKKAVKKIDKRKNKSDDDSYESSFLDSEEEEVSDSEDYSSENSDEDTPVSDSSDESEMDNLWNYQTSDLKRKRSKSSSKRNKKKKLEFGSEQAGKHCEQLRDELLRRLEEIANRLPPNTLDDLIDKLGGPSEVAEMTGRKGRMVMTDDGQVIYESRKDEASLEMMNILEKNKFMSGEKEIAIISEAASSGISLQSDKRVRNQKRRVHITIELPWSADRAIQQFGRTHRSNQTNSPKYIFMISKLAGEQRFASTVARRLESLGALTHGDRRATETRDLSKFNLDSKYSSQALQTVMNIIQGMESPTVPAPEDYKGDFFKDCKEGLVGVGLLTFNSHTGSYIAEKEITLNKFLNRLLGMRIKIQNALFEYFSETMDAYIRYAKRIGKYDQGIMDLTAKNCKMERLEHLKFNHRHSSGVTTTLEIQKFAADRRLSWQEASEMLNNSKDEYEGFWDITPIIYQRKLVVLVIKDQSRSYEKTYYRAYKPNIGIEAKSMSISELKSRGKKINDLVKAKEYWEKLYELSEKHCSHIQYFNTCKRINQRLNCDSGTRKVLCVLTGSILAIWSKIECVLSSNKLQIVRLTTAEGTRCVGVELPSSNIKNLIKILEEDNGTAKNDEQKLGLEIKPKIFTKFSDDEDTDVEFLD